MQKNSFRTELIPQDFSRKISHKSKLITIGSCFADNISSKLSYFKFDLLTQPYGILYNPLIIANNLERSLDGFSDFEQFSIQHNDLWHSFLHHGSFSRPEKKDLLNKISKSEHEASKQLKKADLLIITFGTAFTYFLKDENYPVANCHKIPAKEFDRKLIGHEEISSTFSPVFEKLKAQNPKLEILLTVSPIRHLKDGMHENQLSKANLLLACETLNKELDYTHYFPAYEIMMDDLRDYRFYADDLTHPNDLAIKYIWEKWSYAFVDEKSRVLFKEIDNIQKGINHRPLHPNEKQEKLFTEKLLNKIEQLEGKSGLNFSNEKSVLNQRLTKP